MRRTLEKDFAMKAVEYFKQGYSCSESIVMEAIDQGLVSNDLLPVATSFSGGMGSGCLCGAIAGAQMVIGSLFGRENSKQNEVSARIKAKQFIEEFKKNHKATCCRILTSGMEMSSPERKAHCANMVNDCSKILEEIIKVKV